MRHILIEDDIERMALEMFAEQGYTVLNGLDIAPDGSKPERKSYQDIILIERLRKAIDSIPENKHIPDEARKLAIKQLLRMSSDKLIVNNHTFHTFVVNGIPVEYRKDGKIKYDTVRLIHKKAEDNEFLAVNQYTIIENNINRRPDILLFINGIPIVIIELKNPADPLRLVVVRDMWLTGFDVPCLHSMYVDKPMQAHGLMQAIARVNRVFKDKQGGLIVDYIGIARELKKALTNYTESGGKGKPTLDQEDAVKLMLEKYEVVTAIMHGYSYKNFFSIPPKEKIAIIPNAIEHILKQEDGKERYLKNVTLLVGAFSLSVPHKKALAIKNDVGLFQAIRAAIVKNTATSGKDTDDLDTAIRQIVSKAIISDRVVDIFAAAGLKKPNIAILSDEFLEDVKELPQKNLAFEMLKKLLNDEIRIKMKKNLVQGRSFLEMLEKSIRQYTNKNIETAQVIQELIDLAKNMREANKRGEKLDLNEDEIAFYDALGVNDSAVKILGDKTLRAIAKELVKTVRECATIDWTLKESSRARLRVEIKRVLRKFNYPPDKEKQASELVVEQATVIAKDWAELDPEEREGIRQAFEESSKIVGQE